LTDTTPSPARDSGNASAAHVTVLTAPQSESNTDTAILDRSLITGIFWTGGVRWVTQVLSWTITLLIARILTPEDYGVVGMATVYLGLVQILNDFGLNLAIIQGRSLTEEQIARLGGFAILVSIFFFAVSALVSGGVAAFFGEPRVRAVVIVLSTTFLVSGLQTVPRALLARELQFRRLALIDGCEAIALSTSTLALALAGLSYWALVLGALLSRLLSTTIALAWRRHRLVWPRQFRTIAAAVTFGSHLVVANLAWYAQSSLDFATVGRVLGASALGVYTIGWTLASIPVERLTALVGRVTPPILASVQDDRRALARYVVGLTSGVALLTFPAAIGIALVARDFVFTVLGPQWGNAVVPLQILAAAAVLRSITPILDQVLVATGQTRRKMEINIIAAIVLPACFVVGSFWGVAGVATGWLVGHPVVMVLFLVPSALATVDLSVTSYVRCILPALGGTAIMSAVVQGVHLALPATINPVLLLSLKITAGAGSYLVAVYVLQRDVLRSALGLLKGAMPYNLNTPSERIAVE